MKHKVGHNASPFTTSLVCKAMKDSKNSTTSSADGLTIHQPKHLGPLGIQYLCSLYNMSFQEATLPAIWKHAIILHLLKPGKPKDQSTSYRPISLFCPASKVLEKLMLQRISPHLRLANSCTVANSQHGFRSHRSTTTALLSLAHQVAVGVSQELPPHRTVAMAVDFPKLSRPLSTQISCKVSTKAPWIQTLCDGSALICEAELRPAATTGNNQPK